MLTLQHFDRDINIWVWIDVKQKCIATCTNVTVVWRTSSHGKVYLGRWIALKENLLNVGVWMETVSYSSLRKIVKTKIIFGKQHYLALKCSCCVISLARKPCLLRKSTRPIVNVSWWCFQFAKNYIYDVVLLCCQFEMTNVLVLLGDKNTPCMFLVLCHWQWNNLCFGTDNIKRK